MGGEQKDVGTLQAQGLGIAQHADDDARASHHVARNPRHQLGPALHPGLRVGNRRAVMRCAVLQHLRMHRKLRSAAACLT